MVGNVPVGGDAPITVQTMTNTLTTDPSATIKQIIAAAEAGADIVLFAAEPRLAITALAEVQKAADADIGFTQKLIQSVERVQTLRDTQAETY